ncbi:phosphonate metabolism protein/1,5-bisphosphokinase (PRPP-forming) PhnN [Kiloniella antarctica]|uniref:ribose 1,5-bisphosphate phosphokinase n=1 Tax=Kiloniella antarctica TaxID=1550907 RepID=A0ABW5BLV4_9PROT
MDEQGWLYLIVGPSGAGKDTLLDIARAYFSHSTNVAFPRRYITRPENSGGEDHIAISADEFLNKEKAGLFTFSWKAHNLCYGVPLAINDALASGKSVVVNVSRSVLNEARLEYKKIRIISIVVDKEALRKRLQARGRESTLDINIRLERATAFKVTGKNVIEIDNSIAIEDSSSNFINAIENPYLHTLSYEHSYSRN